YGDLCTARNRSITDVFDCCFNSIRNTLGDPAPRSTTDWIHGNICDRNGWGRHRGCCFKTTGLKSRIPERAHNLASVVDPTGYVKGTTRDINSGEGTRGQ